jgi:hypothetical protein
MYARLGTPAPIFVWCDSPLTAHLAFTVLSPQSLLWSSLELSLGSSLGSSLRSSLWSSLESSLESVWTTSLWGQQDAYWVAYYLYGAEIGATYREDDRAVLDLWAELCRSCMWWWPYRDVCIVSDRPEMIRFDGDRLHNPDGPAVRFRDGWSVWSIDGILVDEQIVLHPETQTIDQIRGEQNAEVKRIRIERLGWQRYLARVDATVVDSRRNEIEQTDEHLVRTADGEVVLICACPSTGRVYALEVPPATATCAAAQIWLSGGLSARIINAA